jgi:hypothetical protein
LSLLLINPVPRPRLSRGLSFARRLALRGTGFSSRLEGSRFASAVRGHRQKVDNVDLERFSNAFDNVERGVEIAALKPADRCAIDSGINRKIFLGDCSGSSDRPKIPCNTRAKLHARMGNILSLFYPSDISNIIQSFDAIYQQYKEPEAQPAPHHEAMAEEMK